MPFDNVPSWIIEDVLLSFISADCWLCVFDLLAPSQLGLGIALISHRFDFYVDEHFKTRKWTLKFMEIWRKNGTREMEIVNCYWKRLPIPQIQMPRKVIGFEGIRISFIGRNAIAFLHRFSSLFAACPINLSIILKNSDRLLEFILRNIWPMLKDKICGIIFYCLNNLRILRHFVPSLLNDCPLLRVVNVYYDDFFIEFPADDSAAASDGQAMAKWLFTPLQSNVPKVLICSLDLNAAKWLSSTEAFKAAFVSASSPVNFIAVIRVHRWPFAASIVPFDLSNKLTREQLTLKRIDYSYRFLFVRCPIARDESKWTKWEEEAIGWQFYDHWKQIQIAINREDEIGDGLLDAMPGPSDHQQK
ncbi:hypothetical protein niasHT_005729 [Heterodera trifolii]|uniref:F-box domain-containing protein n=1 Tax=Heterodera trifolii TaxID=157864 RepID=A0ABD2LYU2_9BILA